MKAISVIEGEFEKCRHTLHMAAMRILNNYHDAEDVVQDAYLRAVRNIDKFDSRLSAYNWLYTITLNLSRNKRRYERVRGREEEFGRRHDDSASIESPVLDEVDARELTEIIEAARSRLTESHVRILELRISQGMTYDAISKRLGIEIGTVRSKIYRAKECLTREVTRMRAYAGM